MKLIESKAELVLQQEGLEGVYKQIELCGRTCYKSSPKYRYWTADKKHFINEGTEDFKMLYSPEEYPIKQNVSAHDFVERMIKSNHTAMLEHGTVYLAMPMETVIPISANGWGKYLGKYSKGGVICTVNGEQMVAITTNLRVLVENGWLDDLKYICEPTEYHERRYTLKLTTDRGVSHELVRHRVFSFAQESTRYCNYSKDKFNNELTFIFPHWLLNRDHDKFTKALKDAQKYYFTLLDQGWTPQEARQVLPNALKTEICMTGFESDWKHFLDLRYFEVTGKAHPDMKELATKIVEQFKNNNIKIGEI